MNRESSDEDHTEIETVESVEPQSSETIKKKLNEASTSSVVEPTSVKSEGSSSKPVEPQSSKTIEKKLDEASTSSVVEPTSVKSEGPISKPKKSRNDVSHALRGIRKEWKKHHEQVLNYQRKKLALAREKLKIMHQKNLILKRQNEILQNKLCMPSERSSQLGVLPLLFTTLLD